MRGRLWLARRRRNRLGAVMVLMGFMLAAILGVCAFVADLGNIIVVKTTMGAAADAAALAGAGAMAEAYSLADAKTAAIEYANINVPPGYSNVLDESNVTFGKWDPVSRTFTPDNSDPDAIRVVVERSRARENAVPYFFGRVFGNDWADVSAEAIAVGAVSTVEAAYVNAVYVTSTRDLSNVVLKFVDGTHQKFDNLSAYTGTFQGTGEHAGKAVAGVWIKSGCNHSDDGPGYGEYIANPNGCPGGSATIHGQSASGCIPHVTATFQATGVSFEESGSASPVRLVR